MSVSSEIVREHLAAVGRFDWTAMEQALAKDVQLELTGTEGGAWTTHGFYRHISQAWDFTVEEIELVDLGDGTVRAEILLSNGAGWVKRVNGEYRLTGTQISAITLTDELAVEAG